LLPLRRVWVGGDRVSDAKLYTGLAKWWPLFSAPEDHAEEAAWIIGALEKTLGRRPASILELGSGGGNTASHLSQSVKMTLVDLNEEMLAVSRLLNPGATHVCGDMREVRLGTTFEAVLIHDAIMYMTTERDLESALATARAHLRDDGILMVLPDHLAETIEAGTDSGGHDASDGSGRGVRYLQWTHAPKRGATTFTVDYAILVREADGSVEVHHDRHEEGVFQRSTWRATFARAGFAPPQVRIDPWHREVFLARPFRAQPAAHRVIETRDRK
jgi:SAM-dependent methyltransferase